MGTCAYCGGNFRLRNGKVDDHYTWISMYWRGRCPGSGNPPRGDA
jgi:hypothetical protein